MDLLLIGTAFLFTFLAVIVWQSVRSGPLTGTELRRRINALHHDNIGHQPAGRYVPPSHDLEPVQVPATVGSGSLTTVDPTAAEPDPARLARGAAVLDRGTAVLEQGVGTRLVPEVLVTDGAQTPRLSVARSGVGTDVADRELVGRSDSFAVSTRATFWTHVTGGRPGDMVRHVWFHENRTVGAVDLALAYNPVHSDYATVYPRSEPYDLAELARALPAHWRRPARAADLVSAPGRNCHLFAALCKLALGGSDEGLLTWARTLNREFSVPLADAEVRGVWRSVCRYRARWRVQGHQQAWLFRQAARGRKGGSASGEARRAGTPLEHDRAPWAALGVSRRTWYRHSRGVKTDGESRWAKVGTEANTDRSVSGYLFLKA